MPNGDDLIRELLEELKAIRERAEQTRTRIETGEAKNGISGLVQIEKRAADAVRLATTAPNAQPTKQNGRTTRS
jgi:hypothetical protein